MRRFSGALPAYLAKTAPCTKHGVIALIPVCGRSIQYVGLRSYQDYGERGSYSQGSRGSFRGGFDDGSDSRRGGGFGQRGGFERSSQNNAGQGLQTQQWNLESMQPIQKSFYKEHPETAALGQQEIKVLMQKLDASVEGNQPHPKPVRCFSHIGLPADLLKLVMAAGFPGPSPIQSIGWPTALSGRDMVAVAQTGSGKTLGFLLPALVHMAAQPPVQPGDGPIALVMAPTRELAVQIQLEAMKFTAGTQVRTVACYGGASRHTQVSQLRRGVEIIIATPGRLLDLVESRETCLRRVSYLVLDEADRMLDMGFEPQIRKVVSQIRPDRQTLLWSATWPKEIQRLARDFCKQEPVKVTIGSEELTTNPKITQLIEVVDERNKRQVFLEFVQKVAQGGERVLVFCAKKKDCDSLARTLSGEFKAESIHGGKEQERRDRILAGFKSGKISILVATDVAQRGLDVKELNYVVNYDIPNNLEDYIHRIGRTARAGATGTALTLFPRSFSPDVCRLAQGITKCMQEVGQEPPHALKELAGGGRR